MAKKGDVVAAARKGSGKRRRYGGKVGVRVKTAKGYTVVPRAHSHGGHSSAWAGFTAHNAPATIMKATDGKFKVPAPTKFWHRSGFYRSAATGEVLI